MVLLSQSRERSEQERQRISDGLERLFAEFDQDQEGGE